MSGAAQAPVRPSDQIDMLKRCLAHRMANTTDTSGAATAFSARHYVDADRLADERRALFRRLPVVAGYSTQIPQPGDYATRDCDGVPVLLVRQDDGGVRAFLNICRHRGARVVTAPTGHSDGRLVCPYHAWSYDTAGALRTIPCAVHFCEVEPATHGLVPLACRERAGLIFTMLTPGLPLPHDAGLERCLDDLEGLGVGGFTLYRTRTVPSAINWKMMIEANREAYHINVLHRDTAGPRFRPQTALLDTFGRHSTTMLAHKTFTPRLMPPDEADWRLLNHSDVAWFLFPNTLLLLSTDAAHVLTAYPDGTDACTVYGVTLLPPGTEAGYPFPYYENYWATILEDIRVSEDIQRAARAQPDQRFWIGGNEWLLRHFHAAIEAEIAGA